MRGPYLHSTGFLIKRASLIQLKNIMPMCYRRQPSLTWHPLRILNTTLPTQWQLTSAKKNLVCLLFSFIVKFSCNIAKQFNTLNLHILTPFDFVNRQTYNCCQLFFPKICCECGKKIKRTHCCQYLVSILFNFNLMAPVACLINNFEQ